MKYILNLTIILTLLTSQVFAQTPKETVAEVLEKSGSLVQFNQIDAMIDAQVAARKAGFENEEDFEKFSKFMKSAFNSESLKRDFISYFEQKANEDTLQIVSEIYENPLVVKMKETETSANDPSKQAEMLAFFQGFQSSPPSPERAQLVVELHKELGTAEMTVSIMKNMIVSIAKGANTLQPEDKRVSEDEILKGIASAFPAGFEQQLTSQLVAMSIYTYKDISDADLEKYVAVWKDPASKYFINMTMEALNYSFSKVGENMGKEMVEEFSK
ncbi:hypothetical protein [Sediminitomix flava]|uniref:DUF2059 domain-containing protein n=1 Tax=Sediminitomix flava TaxID=379075 RepID=A0A315Z7V9_SEDFL|nr:hypothetical protein [Sediminitomix flava]PWJ39126.1 hypothetical protein BC781_10627 [Sediminitomix flava]